MHTLATSVAALLTAAAITGAGAGVASAATPTPAPTASPTIDVTATDTYGRVAVAHLTPAQADGGQLDCIEDTNHLTLNLSATRDQAGYLTVDFTNVFPLRVVVTEGGQTLWNAEVTDGVPPHLVPLPAQS
ncbi:MAG: hypothetical protein J0I34_00435 [Pseudonocardia sp.]|uniref:hypothetical protein n=1 Tax=unclassified Pseudonocardia TaxID=2619320 RepID=UPI00086D80A9|nr:MULTISPECIES: hypothetical protein [unclassified Pseudonocardia]MBN9107222.1 hypothetical protein [Pseudonocardia sp.]ODU26971.1 MAG: hypothetical protein ABS80_05140 [Pseudonocardia sp. SCN 72-51]ODV05332.1 MAG: hypothetical protein ABT15_17725 [Pseudonocardia sp. SCN 73-27]